jgi:hypothetical protein
METKAITHIDPDTGCDVITLKNGNLIYCKIKSIKRSTVEYTKCSDFSSPSVSINADSVFMVNYSSGKSEILHSTKPVHPIFYGSLSIGAALPFGGYSSTQNRWSEYSETVYPAGYSLNGIGYGANFEADLWHGLGGIFEAGYFRYGFDASSFLRDNTYSGALIPVYDVLRYSYKTDAVNLASIEAVNNTFYSTYSFLLGIKKDFHYEEKVTWGFDVSVGGIFIYIPSFATTLNITGADSSGKAFSKNYSWQIASYKTIGWSLNFGLNAKFKITSHIYFTIKANMICQLSSGPSDYFQGKILDTNGNVVVVPQMFSPCDAAILNMSVGLGFYL